MPAPVSNSLDDTPEFAPPGVAARGAVVDLTPTIRLEIGAESHVGLRRSNNEDHFAVVQRQRTRKILLTNVNTAGLSLSDDNACSMIVADGVGGHGFGELASELVLRIGWELAGEAPFWVMKYKPGDIDKIREKVEAYGRQIQKELQDHAEAEPELAGMGTTWTCGYVMGRDAIIAHAGDSRAYLFHEGALRQLTHDHTAAQSLQDAGLPPQEAAEYKHVLVNAFGAHSEKVKIDIRHQSLEDGDRLLLCSDGLTDMVPDDEIAAILQTQRGAQRACAALLNRALHHGGHDNVTVVVADLSVAPVQS